VDDYDNSSSSLPRVGATTLLVVWAFLCFTPTGTPGWYTNVGWPYHFLESGDAVLIVNGELVSSGFYPARLFLDVCLAILAAALVYFLFSFITSTIRSRRGTTPD
jgi:hypothetical protein